MATASPPDTGFDTARRAMIDSQLRTSGVNEPWVLARMASVAREDFVPPAVRSVAYIDRALPLGEGGGMLAAPLVHARMLAEARPVAADRVLVVDGGSGYLPALLEGVAGSITVVSPADAVKGARGGDFTVLLIDGAVEHVPSALGKRLTDGARVVTGMITDGVTRLAIGRKVSGAVSLLPLAEMGIPRLAAFDKPKAWSF